MFGNKWLVMGLVGVLLAATAGGTWFVARGSAPAAMLEEGEQAPSKQTAKPLLHSLDPSFVVNLLNERSTRFLQVDLQVMTYSDEVIGHLEDYQVRIRHELIMMFSGLSKDMINSLEGRKQIQRQTVDTVNAVLETETGVGGIEDAYFTKFVMQ